MGPPPLPLLLVGVNFLSDFFSPIISSNDFSKMFDIVILFLPFDQICFYGLVFFPFFFFFFRMSLKFWSLREKE